MSSNGLTRNPVAALLAALVIHAAHAAPAHGWDNVDRYRTLELTLRETAPAGEEDWTGLAGVAFDTARDPITFTNYDTPDPGSFGSARTAILSFGSQTDGLGNATFGTQADGTACKKDDNRIYGRVWDIRYLWSVTRDTPPYRGCATNTHLMYNRLLQAVRECGPVCFVDVASLSNIELISSELRGAIGGWIVNNKIYDNPRLVLRITEGIIGGPIRLVANEVNDFSSVIRDGKGKVEVYIVPFATAPGRPLAGLWSHAKLFAVHDVSGRKYKALIGGQNHWHAYDHYRPPYDSNTLIEGLAATLPSLQLDAALRRLNQVVAPATIGRNLRWGPLTKNSVLNQPFRWLEVPFIPASFARFSAIHNRDIRNVNPDKTALPHARTKAFVSLMDMGSYSAPGPRGRTISWALSALTIAEEDTIRVFQQQLCRAAEVLWDGNCSHRSLNTAVGSLVFRALTAARNEGVPGRDSRGVRVLTSSSPPIGNGGYDSPTRDKVRHSLYVTGASIVCKGDGYREFRFDPDNLRTFDNKPGTGTCAAAVVRALNKKFNWRTTTALLNGTENRQDVGVHHKLMMFGQGAMYQGSYNLYQSGIAAATDYDSKLVENGGIIFDPQYVGEQVKAFDEAWDHATYIMGALRPIVVPF